MKVLFIASGNNKVDKASSFIISQYKSLQESGLDMTLYSILGHGVRTYWHHMRKVHQLIKQEPFDIIHAHYSTSGFLATLAAFGIRYQTKINGRVTRQRPKVFVSILGSYKWGSWFRRKRTQFFIRHIWDGALTKSQRTADELGVNVPVVPNGVNLKQFTIVEKQEARRQLGLDSETKYVMFITDPKRPEKNFPMSEAAFNIVKNAFIKSRNPEEKKIGERMELKVVCGLPHNEVVKYMCAADVVIMTSTTEGSPNVIKESMACNCPIVCTDVGDVPWLLDGVRGSYLVREYTNEAVAEALKKALKFEGRTNGREKIYQLELTTEQVAARLIGIYNTLLNQK